MSEEVEQYELGWCPYCGGPEEVCDDWGGCNKDENYDYEDEDCEDEDYDDKE